MNEYLIVGRRQDEGPLEPTLRSEEGGMGMGMGHSENTSGNGVAKKERKKGRTSRV